MKKLYLFTSIILLTIAGNSQAQFYSQGDVSLNFQPLGSHDSSLCATQSQLMYFISIQNSFLGDSVKVKDEGSGMIIYEEANTTGQNPWNVMAPNFMASGYVPDNQVIGGVANFFGPPTKVISGPDTIYNIANFYIIPVPDPCSYGNVTGKIYVDYNSDCIYNGTDVPLSSIAASSYVNLNSPSMSSTSSVAYSDGTGYYNMQVQESWMTSFNVQIPSQYQFIFPSTACSPVVYNFTSLSQSNVDFSLQCTNNLDVRCAIGATGIVRPNIPFILNPYVNNTGCNAASGVLTLVLDPNVNYNAALSSNPATTVSGDTLFWNYTNLSNLSNGMYWNSFFAGVYLTPNSSVNIGDILCFQVATNIPAGDVDTSNNSSSICLAVVNSYDPNIKEVAPRGIGVEGNILPSTPSLNYTIHFQNTGTAPAYNVSVIDTLDSDIIAGSLEILGTSHSMVPEWIGPGVVKFNFYGIQLPDSTSNELNSHGFVSFKATLHNALPLGTQITNRAYIYFDSNPAVITNTTLNTIAIPTGLNEINSGNAIVTASPNPFTDITTIKIENRVLQNVYSMELTDVIGKKVKTITGIAGSQFQISRTGLNDGIYFYKIYDQTGVIGKGKLVIR